MFGESLDMVAEFFRDGELEALIHRQEVMNVYGMASSDKYLGGVVPISKIVI